MSEEMLFTPAKRYQAKARFAIDGVSGSGKTYTALVVATALAEDGKIAVLDTEHGSASLYSDVFNFDVKELDAFDPKLIIGAIEFLEQNGYAVLVIDSLSHFWEGEGGLLDSVDKIAKSKYQNNSFAAWKDGSPIQRKMIDAILQSKLHVVVTMRSKTEYSVERDEKTGKMTPKKVGLAPVQRQGIEYEFQVVGDMDINHNLIITKSRCSILQDEVFHKPTVESFTNYVNWLKSCDVMIEKPKDGTSTHTSKYNRPLRPEIASEMIHKKAAGYGDDHQVTVAFRKETDNYLDRLFEQQKDAAIEWLTDCVDILDPNATPGGVVQALHDWIAPEQDGVLFVPSKYAEQEATEILSVISELSNA